MKKVLITLIFITACFSNVRAGNEGSSKDLFSNAIDIYDTVVFDLSQMNINGSYVDFPVSVLSDDSVYSLDFAFKFNQLKLVFDSILDDTNYMQSLYYYNAIDSTVRFTSNATHIYAIDSPLVTVRFIANFFPLEASDFSSIEVYLNGYACSWKIIDPLHNTVERLNDFEINIYPNPSTGRIEFQSDGEYDLRLIETLQGKPLLSMKALPGLNQIYLRGIPAGTYALIMQNQRKKFVKKIVIVN